MPRIIPSLFKLISDGFIDDAYAADGNHLRWMFDPRLGFPRYAICLERRPSVATKHGQQGVERFGENFMQIQSAVVERLVRPSIAVSRPGRRVVIQNRGIKLDKHTTVLDFHGGSSAHREPYACWLRLHFKVLVPNGRLQAKASYNNRGHGEAVDQQRRIYVKTALNQPDLRPTEVEAIKQGLTEAEHIMKLVRNPDHGPAPLLHNPEEIQLYRKLLRVDRIRYRLVTRNYLRSILRELRDHGLTVNDLLPLKGVIKDIIIELRAEQIDRVAITGRTAWLSAIQWIRAEDLMQAPGWGPVNCYPMPTKESDYTERNRDLFDGQPIETIVKHRLLDPRPHGAEPLDVLQVPPTRPPSDSEIEKRYVMPWLNPLEPWLATVLSESLSEDLHQAEVTILCPLSEAGQVHGDGLPAVVTDIATEPTMEVRPYGMLLAAASAFPVARLLGLAAIDRPPSGIDIWDYRVRGRWLIRDIRAWEDKLLREIRLLFEQYYDATPDRRNKLAEQILNLNLELTTTRDFVNNLTRGVTGDYAELWALKVGVQATRHDLFAAPERLDARYDGLGLPPDPLEEIIEAVARLEWPLRQRARVIIDEEIPMGAAIGRGDAGVSGPFPSMINPKHPDLEMSVPVVPAGPEEIPGASGQAVFYDRHVRDGENYRFGVSEEDPFGRWSHFTETTFRWDYDIPPAVPVQVSGELNLMGRLAILELTVNFSWPTDLNLVEGHRFSIHLRRSSPPIAESDGTTRRYPSDLRHWGHCERSSGTGADPFSFDGTFDGSDTHDGMSVMVSSSDRIVTDEASEREQQYRDFTVTFTGLEVERDAIGRAQLWIGVSVRDVTHGLESTEVGGPARAEHIIATPPPPPTLPSEPEQATYADAQGVSSYTLEWDGLDEVRYVIYRAGERELIQFVQEDLDRDPSTFEYNEVAESNFRAAALKRISALSEARDVFQPRSGVIPEPPKARSGEYEKPKDWSPLHGGRRTFTDKLYGKLRTLTVYTILGRSQSGVLSEWPSSEDNFVVVEVPHVPEPARPAILRARWQPAVEPLVEEIGIDSARIELLIAEPPEKTAAVDSYEVYRTLDPSKTYDYRLMRPMHSLDSPEYEEQEIPELEAAHMSSHVATYVDPTILPWRTYYYRVVTRAPGLNGAAKGMRSEASSLIRVDTLSSEPPAAPTAISTERIILEEDGRTRMIVRVSFEAEAPTTPAGDFVFEILDLTEEPSLIAGRATATLVRQSIPNQYQIDIDSEILPADTRISVRVTDPLGQSSQSMPVTVV